MNRRVRRAILKRSGQTVSREATKPSSQPAGIEELFAAAMTHRQNGEFVPAQTLCRAILARDPKHVGCLIIMGGMAQQQGRYNLALKYLGQALTLDERNPRAHDNLALTYQALGRHVEAERHFSKAIALGLGNIEALIKQSAAVSAPMNRLAAAWPRQLTLAELFGQDGIAAITQEGLLLALLQSRAVCDLEIERFLSAIRMALLQFAVAPQPDKIAGDDLRLWCALAQQCFINEYIFALSEPEREEALQLRDRLVDMLDADADCATLAVIVTAMYWPLHTLPSAAKLLDRPWPDVVSPLLTQQIREPWEEAADRPKIPALTASSDSGSLENQKQYDENPYPRWNTPPRARQSTLDEFLRGVLGVSRLRPSEDGGASKILIAGCGTGAHSIETAQRFADAQVLAIDISRTSLAYARRKTREAGVHNIEYAQADILKLGSIGRSFDVIEAVGVLHHLSDPAKGWSVLLSLLRPRGLMLVGVFSALGERAINASQSFITERGYRPTADNIRACRQELIHRGQAIASIDFFSTSGCRALWFNAVEHQFSIPELKASIEADRLTFLGFEVSSDVRVQFERKFPEPGAATDLDCWHRFEQEHPATFTGMYKFWVQKG